MLLAVARFLRMLVQEHTWSKGALEHTLSVGDTDLVPEASGHRQSLVSEASLNFGGNSFERVSPKVQKYMHALKIIFIVKIKGKLKVFIENLRKISKSTFRDLGVFSPQGGKRLSVTLIPRGFRNHYYKSFGRSGVSLV